MFRMRRQQHLPIGLDLGSDSVKLLQPEVQGETLSVRSAVRRELPVEARAGVASRIGGACSVLRDLLDEGNFAGRRVVAAVPREFVHVKNFRLPPMPLAELEGAVPLEARNLFTFDVDRAQVRFLPAGDVRQGNDVLQEIIVLAVKNDDIDSFVEQVHRAGVILDALDFAPSALYRCVERFMRRREDETEVNVLVDVGLRATQVVIGRGRDVSFMKTIELGGLNLQEAVSRKLSISIDEAKGLRRRYAEAANEPREGGQRDPVRQAASDATRGLIEQLAREISLCLRYHSVTFRGQRPTRVRVYGGEAADPQLRTLFNAILTIPVDPGKPLFNLETGRVPDVDPHDGGEWALALGMALKSTDKRFAARDGRSRQSLAAARLQATEPDTGASADAVTVGAGAGTSEPVRQEGSHA